MSRRFKYGTDTHHRVPRSRHGTNDPKNLSTVCKMHHQSFHILFKNWLPEKIAEELNRKWIDPDKMFIVVDREKHQQRCKECGRVVKGEVCDNCDFWKGGGLA